MASVVNVIATVQCTQRSIEREALDQASGRRAAFTVIGPRHR